MPEASAWRIDKAKWSRSSFTGIGASYEGGRWNPAGLSVVYLSRHLPMAALEKLVHLPKPISNRVRYIAFAVHFNDVSLEVYPRARLPVNWDKKPLLESTQRIVWHMTHS